MKPEPSVADIIVYQIMLILFGECCALFKILISKLIIYIIGVELGTYCVATYLLGFVRRRRHARHTLILSFRSRGIKQSRPRQYLLLALTTLVAS